MFFVFAWLSKERRKKMEIVQTFVETDSCLVKSRARRKRMVTVGGVREQLGH